MTGYLAVLARAKTWMMLAVVVAVAGIAYYGAAERPTLADDATATEAESTIASEESAESEGRLPAYFSEVVDEKQKEAIYRIQAQYEERIEALEAQLKALVDERDAAIHALLNDEQRKQIAQIAADREEERRILAEFRAKRDAERQRAESTD